MPPPGVRAGLVLVVVQHVAQHLLQLLRDTGCNIGPPLTGGRDPLRSLLRTP